MNDGNKYIGTVWEEGYQRHRIGHLEIKLKYARSLKRRERYAKSIRNAHARLLAILLSK